VTLASPSINWMMRMSTLGEQPARALVTEVVPVQVDLAEFEIQGTSESQKPGAAKKIFMGSWHSDEQASINVTDLKSGEVVYAYSANKKNSAHGKQTSAEACAKHLKEAIEKGR
jgi:proline dehydrogenase